MDVRENEQTKLFILNRICSPQLKLNSLLRIHSIARAKIQIAIQNAVKFGSLENRSAAKSFTFNSNFE